MIDLEEFKEILQDLVKDREDAPDILDKIKTLDKPMDDLVKDAVEKVDKEWNERYTKAFFSPSTAIKTPEPEPESEPEPPSYDTLFKEN